MTSFVHAPFAAAQRDVAATQRASGKPGIDPPSTLMATTLMPCRTWKASSVGAKAWQYGQSLRKKKKDIGLSGLVK